jgi:hypothetical protein
MTKPRRLPPRRMCAPMPCVHSANAPTLPIEFEALAKSFAITIQGMRAMARLKSDRRGLRQVAKVALAALD